MPLYGLAISTYFNIPEPCGRFDVFKKAFSSILKDTEDYPVFLVDDGSPFSYHLDYAEQIDINKRVIIHRRASNGGISKTKNTCLRLLKEAGCEFLFLSDDDVEHLKPGATHYYTHMNHLTGIKHFSFFAEVEQKENVSFGDAHVSRTPKLNGCFMMIHRSLLDTVGYFKVLSYGYGHEHTNYTRRVIAANGAPFFCDAPLSQHYLRLLPESGQHPSVQVDWDKVNENWPQACDLRPAPLEE